MIYGYTRVSTEEQADGTSLDTQQRQITGVAMASDLSSEIDWLVDAGVSGATDFFSRPAVKAIDLQAGDIIICAHIDRFTRDARFCLNAIHELKRMKVSLFLNGHGDVTDDNNVAGQLMLEIMAAVVGHERRAINERCSRGRNAKKTNGGHIGGSAPWGARVVGKGKDAKIKDIFRQQAIARMVALRQESMSYRAIAQIISRDYDEPISHMAVSRILNGQKKSA
jgi:DNA invertase Pin-like site-specific DNA recombinase